MTKVSIMQKLIFSAGALCIVFVSLTVIAQQTPWEKSTAAGVKAAREGRFVEAEKLFEEGLKQAKKSGVEDAQLAMSLVNLALAKKGLGKFGEAEPLLKHALSIREKVLGPEHPAVASCLNELGILYYDQTKPRSGTWVSVVTYEASAQPGGRNTPAEMINFPSDKIDESIRASRVAKYMQGEPLLKRALSIREKILPPQHPDLAASAQNLGGVLLALEKYVEAEPLFQRALAIREKIYEPDDARVADSAAGLAGAYRLQKKYVEAEPLYKRALAIREKVFGPEDPKVAETLFPYSALLKATNRTTEGAEMEARAKRIWEKSSQKKPAK